MEAIEHYKKKLQRHIDEPDVVLYCLKKLDSAPVTIELLTDSDVGRVVNRLKKKSDTSQEVIKASKALVEKWKELVKNAEDEAEVGQVSIRGKIGVFDNFKKVKLLHNSGSKFLAFKSSLRLINDLLSYFASVN